jgi:hypothetical protein
VSLDDQFQCMEKNPEKELKTKIDQRTTQALSRK